MEEIDKWAAEQCGVEIHSDFTNDGKIYTRHSGKYREWTIQDSRCREIVREHFRIEMYRVEDSWVAFQYLTDEDASIEGKGKTIAEAEIACIKEIYHEQIRTKG